MRFHQKRKVYTLRMKNFYIILKTYSVVLKKLDMSIELKIKEKVSRTICLIRIIIRTDHI